MSKPRIGIVGFIGWGNFGDELFLSVYKQYLSEHFEVSLLHETTSAPYFTRPVEEAVAEVDAIVIGGGDLVIPWQLSGLYWQEAFLDKPVFLVGLGVPRWGGYNEKVVAQMRTFVQHPNVRFIHARDVESRNWIEQHLAPEVNVHFAPDIVCALDLPEAPRAKDPILGVVTRKRKNEGDDLFWVERLCEKAARLGYGIHHLVLGVGDVGQRDTEAAEALRFPGKKLIRSESLDELCAEIGRCTALASMKFHGSVVATMYGVPSIVLSATDKNRSFMSMIERRELLSSLNDARLPDRFSPYMPSIPTVSRDYLRAASSETMHMLVDAVGEAVAA